jgi:hypothetical protein
MTTVPPSDSFSQYRRSMSPSSPLRLTVMVLPGLKSVPGGVSDAMSQ